MRPNGAIHIYLYSLRDKTRVHCSHTSKLKNHKWFFAHSYGYTVRSVGGVTVAVVIISCKV